MPIQIFGRNDLSPDTVKRRINRIKDVITGLSKVQRIISIVFSAALFAAALVMFTPDFRPKVYETDFAAIRQTEEGDLQKMQLRGISLPRGVYDINLGYVAKESCSIEISLGNSKYLRDELAQTGQDGAVRTYHFELGEGTDRGRIDFEYSKKADLQLAFLNINSDRMIYTDGIVWGIIMILLIPGVWMSFWFYNRSTHKASLVITVIAVVVQIIPFIVQRGIHIGVDSQTHMMRIEGIYYGLLDGQFPVVLYPEWNNSYGQIGVLYPNVFLYIPALFRLLGMSQLGVCKLFIYLTITASALIALGCARTIFKRDWHINLCVIALSLEDIRLWDLMWRGRVQGSFLAEMFLPLVVAGLIEILYKNRKKWYLAAYGMAGIVCSHITSLTVTVLGVAIFVLLSIKRIVERKVYREIVYALILFTGLIFGTAVCFLAFYSGDYSGNLIWREFTDMLWNLKGTPDSHKWISVFGKVVICIGALILSLIRKQTKQLKGEFAIPLFISALILTWMSTTAFPWTILRSISIVRYYTDMLQSGDRFLNVAAVMLSFCIPAMISAATNQLEESSRKPEDLSRRFSRTAVVSYAAITILSVYNLLFNVYAFFVSANDYMYYDSVVGEIEVDSDDYLPAGTQIEWYQNDNGYISDEKAVSSLSYDRNGTHIYYSYTNSKDGAYVEFPKFYYKGYVAEDEAGNPTDVSKGDRNRIRIGLKTTNTPAMLKVWYSVPWWMSAATILSFAIWLDTPFILALRINRRIS